MTTKPEKMTDEELSTAAALSAQESSSAETERWRRWVNRLLSHIAALTAEGDRFIVQVRQVVTTCERLGWNGVENPKSLTDYIESVHEERDALRKRVQVLEVDLKTVTGHRDDLREKWAAGHTRLSAICQRAKEVRTNLIGAVQAAHGTACGPEALTVAATLVRFVVGEDAAGQVCGGHDIGELCGSCGNTGRMPVESAPEPTTAEAFATVRDALPFMLDGSGGKAARGRAALSLLEHRVGAMDAAARTLLRRLRADLDDVSEPTRFSPETHFALGRLQKALTDAPPVFTLEEVEALGLDLLVCMCDVQYGQSENHHETCSGSTVRERLTALQGGSR